ncbi:hypothetical protein [Nonomuraea sp. B19D2]|uniref:hypothetical protein n=1 Tax=Nonomuraea sp. B19D2 TaxID=3159561 RepID=UPI0032DA09C4
MISANPRLSGFDPAVSYIRVEVGGCPTPAHAGRTGSLVVVGFACTFIPDGSNNNGAEMLLGCLTAFVLFMASLGLIVCAAMFETGSADR